MLWEKVLDLGPTTLDEVLAAAQRYESNQRVLNKGIAHVLTSTSEEIRDGNFTSPQGAPEPPVSSAALSTTSRNFREVEKYSSRMARYQ